MCSPGVKLGLYLPATLHGRMVAAVRGRPRGALQAAYDTAFREVLDLVESGAELVFAAVRGPKVRVTVRLCAALCARLRRALAGLNLKVTDFACTALGRYLSNREGA
jgi:hypothetical protein